MAQPTYEYSGVCYTATSGQTIFALTSTDGNPIGYLSPDHIHVRTSADSGETWVPLPVNTAWTFADPATSIVLVTPATAGEWIDIRRKTPIDQDWVDFQAGSLLTAGQLNDAETFSLYCDQELADDVHDLTPPEVGLNTTDDLPEGEVNLYYTDERVAEYIAENPSGLGVTKIIPGTNITLTPSTGEGVVTINSTGGGGSGGVSYKGLVDVTQPAPANPQEGDLWANTTEGVADASWIGIAGETVGVGDQPIYNGTEWDVFPRPPIVGAVESVNGQTGIVSIGVEELDDFAYYPASNEGILEGPLVNGTEYPTLSGSEFFCGTTGSNAVIWFSKENTQLYDILNTLEVGDALNVFYGTSFSGYGWNLRKDTTFVALGVQSPNTANWAFVMSGGWTGIAYEDIGQAIPGKPTRGPIRFESSFIDNGSLPLESGQALVYNKETKKWRPQLVDLKVEELADFAYYPASEQVTLLGPCVADAGTFSGTEYTSGSNTNLYFVFPKTNTQVYDVLNQLSAGDSLTVCFYSSVGTVYTEVETTFSSLGNNGGAVPSWYFQVSDNVPGAVLGNYPVVFKSPLITNGQAPITTGQALIYDQTTETWRPEDIAAELNISALPALP